MDKKTPPLRIGLAFKEALPESVDAGAEFSFSVVAAWPEGVATNGAKYCVRAGEKIIRSGDLPKPADDGSIALTLTAPAPIGAQRWILVVGNEHAEGALTLAFATVPHATSLAVWDNPSPVVRGAAFNVKVGAKCSASCGLGGRNVEIRDDTDKVIGSGALGDATWAGTASLYWTTLRLKAPRKLGLHAWTVRFAPAELELPHGGAASQFSFVTVAEPEHSVSVKVVDKKTKKPVANAQVRLGLYRAVTDKMGAAKIAVPKGEFPLIVTRAGYEAPERSVAVSKNLRVRIAAEALPEEDPFATWTA
jgi:hypothetical protein